VRVQSAVVHNENESGILSFAMEQLTPGIQTALQLYELDERSLKESA